jgi:hypothetical protein
VSGSRKETGNTRGCSVAKKPKVMVDDGPPEGWVHPSQDTTGRFAVDQLIRSHGWAIHSRKRGKEPVWTKLGVLLTQLEVLMVIPEEQIRVAEELELTYYCF